MEQFRSRITELADRAYSRGIVLFSDFLDLNQLNTLQSIRWKDYGVQVCLSGGYDYAERQMAAFVPDAFSLSGERPQTEPDGTILAAPGWPFPIRAVRIVPSAPRFAEALTHRDFLGAILSLGIDRSRIGDLIVQNGTAVLFASEPLVSFLCSELTSVRHTQVFAEPAETSAVQLRPETEERVGSVASLRLDTLIALAFGISRSRAAELVSGGVVFVNAKLVTSNGHPPREGDLISVRGHGKCRFCGVLHATKKGRMMVKVERFV